VSKSQEIREKIYTYIWVITWLSAIWVTKYNWELFFTGLFCFILGTINAMVTTDKEKKDDS